MMDILCLFSEGRTQSFSLVDNSFTYFVNDAGSLLKKMIKLMIQHNFKQTVEVVILCLH